MGKHIYYEILYWPISGVALGLASLTPTAI